MIACLLSHGLIFSLADAACNGLGLYWLLLERDFDGSAEIVQCCAYESTEVSMSSCPLSSRKVSARQVSFRSRLHILWASIVNHDYFQDISTLFPLVKYFLKGNKS